MAGGAGTRLWPISRESCPKQFLKIFNNKSLMQLTLERNKIFGRATIIITKDHYNLAKNQAAEIGIDVDVVVEPIGKNTAPCAIIASLTATEEEVLLLLPCDHYIDNIENYISSIYKGIEAAKTGNISIFGVPPTDSFTGYGYIKTSSEKDGFYGVEKFIEKPSFQNACQYSSSSTYYWNSGIFIFKPQTLIDLALTLQPNMYLQASNAFSSGVKKDGDLFLGESYEEITCNSIDFAFIEKASNLLMIKSNFGWHDLGGWKSLWDLHEKDEIGNTTFGEVELYDTSNSYIQSDGRITAVIGVNDIIVINTPDASLIVHKSRAEDVKHLVQNLVSKSRAKSS